MKVILSNNGTKFSIYVPKKDLEEDVVAQSVESSGKILTLANGWRLQIENLNDETHLPQTFDAKRLPDE